MAGLTSSSLSSSSSHLFLSHLLRPPPPSLPLFSLLSRPLSLSPTRLHAPPLSLSLSSLRHTHSLSSSHLSPQLETDTESTDVKLPKRVFYSEADKGFETVADEEEEGVDVNLPKWATESSSEYEDEAVKGFETEGKGEKCEGIVLNLPKRAIESSSEDENENGFVTEGKEEKGEGNVVKLSKRATESSSEYEDEDEKGFEKEGKEEKGEGNVVNLPKRDSGWVKLPSLSVKEKKEIGSYAHSLGKKLKSQQVGKGGVTEAVGVALVESLEKNELLKIKIHNNCPGEIDDNVKRLEELTGSVVVGQIGRTVILYRPSMTKLKAEEKKKHALGVVSRRRQAFKSLSENRGLVPKEYGRGRRGGSRYSSPS